MISHEFFQVDESFFNDKICLDAGCGSNVNGTRALINLGAKKVHAFDLDVEPSFIETAQKFLKKFEGKYELKSGSVLDIPYEDNFFDFVYCNGVLHSTTDLFGGLSELSRVTKHGGTLYFSIFYSSMLVFYSSSYNSGDK